MRSRLLYGALAASLLASTSANAAVTVITFLDATGGSHNGPFALDGSSNNYPLGTLGGGASATLGTTIASQIIVTAAGLQVNIASGGIASGGVASGAFASGAIGSGAIASGAIASGAAVSGAFATGAITDLAIAQAATTSGKVGNMPLGSVTTSAPSYSNGQLDPLSLDTAGNLRVNVVAGGGSGGTSAADAATWTAGTTAMTAIGCEFTTGGATALTTAHMGTVGCTTNREMFVNVVNTNANGSAVSASSSPVVIASDQAAVATKLNTTPSDANGNGVLARGVSASGATLSENPLADGGRAATAQPTAVTDGQKVAMMMSTQGKQVLLPYAPSGLVNNANGSSTSTTAITVQAASGSASFKEYMTKLHCGRSDAGTTAITLAISDGTTTVTEVLPNNGGGGVANYSFDPPLAWVVNHAVTVVPSSGVTTLVCDAEGFNAS